MDRFTTGKNERQRMKNYLADTTLLVDHLRGNRKATAFLEEFNPCVSTVTVAGLIQGSKNQRDQTLTLKVCTAFTELSIDKKISNRAIGLMKKFYLSHGLMFLDALIAATALENKMILVTDNTKHFKFVTGLKIMSQKQILM